VDRTVSGLVAAAGRPVLRVSAQAAADDDVPTRVLRIDPADGAVGVFGDAPVVAVLSRPLDRPSVNDTTFEVRGDAGPVAGTLRTSPDGRAVVWTPTRPLTPGQVHQVAAAGLRDARGQPVEPHRSTFVPCAMTESDLLAP
jgi:hypothetical protein